MYRKKITVALAICALCLTALPHSSAADETGAVLENPNQLLSHYRELQLPDPDAQSLKLKSRLKVPDLWSLDQSFHEGNMKLHLEAKPSVPEVTAVPVYPVTPQEFSPETVDIIRKAFFDDAPLYDPEGYYTLGACPQAECSPSLDFGEASSDSPDTEATLTSLASMKDGLFSFKIKSTPAFPMEVEVARQPSEDTYASMANTWIAPDFQDEGIVQSLCTREEAEKLAQVTPEEAVQITDVYVEKLGLSDFSPKDIELAVCRDLTALTSKTSGQDPAEKKHAVTAAGYLVRYTRDLDGIPITAQSNYGGAYEDETGNPGHSQKAAPDHAWGYETLEFYVNSQGLQYACLMNLYQVGEPVFQSVDMLSFSELSPFVQNGFAILPVLTKCTCDMDISRITLSYSRIYDPWADPYTGYLVPVWDFFGEYTETRNSENASYTFTHRSPDISLLTVNAVDGSIINRSLGY